jgi:hypothetical protein
LLEGRADEGVKPWRFQLPAIVVLGQLSCGLLAKGENGPIGEKTVEGLGAAGRILEIYNDPCCGIVCEDLTLTSGVARDNCEAGVEVLEDLI